MSVRSRIILIVIIPLLLLAGAVSMHTIRGKAVTQANLAVTNADRLASSFGALSILAQEHAVHFEQRGQEQWLAAYRQTGKTVEAAAAVMKTKENKSLYDQIAKSYRNLGILFDQYKTMQGNQKSTGRISSRIVQELQQVATDISALREMNSNAASEANTRNYQLSLGLFAASALVTLIISFFLYRSIGTPVSKLHEALSLISKGDLATRLNIKQHDEFGKIATEFNRMLDARQKSENSLRESENRLKESLDRLKMPSVSLDANGAVTYCNANILEITGRQRSEVIGKNWFDLFMPNNKTARQQFSQMLSRGEAPEDDQLDITTKSGEQLSVVWNYTLQRDVTGGPITGVTTIGRDMTLQLHNEQLLKRGQAKLRSLIDSAPDSILLVKRDGTILAANRTASEMLNRHSDEIDGSNYYKPLPQDLESERRKMIEKAFSSSMPAEFSDIQGLSHLDHFIYPIKDNKGNVDTAGIFSYDVSGRKRADLDSQNSCAELGRKNEELTGAIGQLNLELKELKAKNLAFEKFAEESRQEVARLSQDRLLAKDSLTRINHTRTEFLANMSHEIRTPMNAILGLIHLALQTALSSKQKEYLNTINRSAHTLIGIINDILDFSKIESGSLKLESVSFSLRDVIERAENLLKIHAAEKGMAIEVNIPDGIPDSLTGDPLRLEQVIANLMGNAIKFSEHGPVKLELYNLTETENPKNIRLSFSVEDHGIGMTEEQISNLFIPFSQLDGSSTRKHGGTGLGLSICKHLADLMAGEITVTSMPGVGSTFTFTANFTPGSRTPHQKIAETKKSSKARDLAIRGKRILIVEDNQINLLVVKELLENVGVLSETAKNGREALEIVKDHGDQLKCILMDIQMPVMDGLEATKLIREIYNAEQLPILAMTAHDFEDDLELCLKAGMNAHISKPIAVSALLDIVATNIDSSSIQEMVNDRLSDDREEDIDEALENIPGIEIEAALERLNGNRLLLARLLRLFAQEHHGMGREIGQLMREGDFDSAARLAHSLKGVARNLSAEHLQKATAMLEEALKKQDKENSGSLFQKFEYELNKVCTAAEQLKNLPQMQNTDREISSLTTEECFKTLKMFLETNDLEAQQVFMELRQRLTEKYNTPVLEKLGEAIDRLAYQQALQLLKELEQTQGSKVTEVI